MESISQDPAVNLVSVIGQHIHFLPVVRGMTRDGLAVQRGLIKGRHFLHPGSHGCDSAVHPLHKGRIVIGQENGIDGQHVSTRKAQHGIIFGQQI